MSELILVPQGNVLGLLPDIMPMLEPAIQRTDGHWEPYDVAAALLVGQMHLWIAISEDRPEAACVTRFIDYPRVRVLGLMFIGGKGALEIILDHEGQMAEWAKQMGCREFEGYARKGWLRFLTHWKPHWTYITREI